MLKILFKKCCENCPHIDVEVDQIWNCIGEVITVINCNHMSVRGDFKENKVLSESEE